MKGFRTLSPISTDCKVMDSVLPERGLISITSLADIMHIKENTLINVLNTHYVPILKLGDSHKGWFVNLRRLAEVSMASALKID